MVMAFSFVMGFMLFPILLFMDIWENYNEGNIDLEDWNSDDNDDDDDDADRK
jgi:hypothetical protein